MLAYWEEVPGGQACYLWGKNDLISHIQLLPLFCAQTGRCLMLEKCPPSGFDLSKAITITPPLLVIFLRARNFNRLIS